jgi:putative membrane protein
MKAFFQRWLVTAVAVLVAAQIVPGLEYDSLPGLLAASLVLGILNAFLRPLLLLLSLPILLLTFGLFAWVVNASLLYFVGYLVKSFHVNSFWAALWGALVISIVSMIANLFWGQDRGPRRPRPPQGGRKTPVDTGSGPVIDV